MTETYTIRPIGITHSPLNDPEEVRRSDKSRNICEVEVFPEFAQGLEDIEGFSHVVIVFWMDRARYGSIMVTPIYHPEKKRGVFSTLSPNRPNKVGITMAELLERRGNILKIRGIDILDNTPVIDIKPYTKSYVKEITKFGWMGHEYPNAKT